MADPVAELRAAVEARPRPCATAPSARAPRRRSSGRRSPSSATTRPTRRCCWRPPSGSSRGGSPRGSPSELGRSLEGTVERVEVAGPGFLNLFLADAWYRRAAAELAEQGERLGRPAGADQVTERINVEFVSANPTGPLTAAERAARRLRRLGRAAARVHRAPGGARVLRQRPRRPDRPLRGVDRGADEGRAGARGRLRGRVRRPSSPSRLDQEGIDAGRHRRAGAARDGADDASRSRRRCAATASIFDTWSSERALHESGCGRAGARRAARGRPRLRERGRDLAAHHRASATTRTAS